jgi:hypothetical protein
MNLVRNQVRLLKTNQVMKPRAMVQHIHQEINGIMFANELELP